MTAMDYTPSPDLAARIQADLYTDRRNEIDAGQRFADCIRSCDATPDEAEAIRQRWLSNGGRL